MAEPIANGNGDQRVTNATIAIKIDHMNSRIEEVLKRLEELDKCQRADHEKIITLAGSVKDNTEEIDRLRSRFDIWSGANSIWNGINSLAALLLSQLGVPK